MKLKLIEIRKPPFTMSLRWKRRFRMTHAAVYGEALLSKFKNDFLQLMQMTIFSF